MNSIAEVLANPSAFGISFDTSVVSKGVGPAKVAVGSAPLLTVRDFGLFEAAFPGVLLKHSNGQSVRVHGQAITRNMLVADRSVSEDKMKEAQIKGICFGQAVSVTTKVVEKIVTVEVEIGTEKQAALIAGMVDAGMDYATALAIVTSVK